MIGRTNAGGGGTVAGKFNFEIYYGSDTSELSNPKENTIFAVTEIAVPKWQFSGIEPANPVNGMLWFVLGNTGKNMMNITTGNTTIIYCDSVKQYADGAWKSVDVYSRINGSWKQFSATKLVLLAPGIMEQSISGGFSGGSGWAITNENNEKWKIDRNSDAPYGNMITTFNQCTQGHKMLYVEVAYNSWSNPEQTMIGLRQVKGGSLLSSVSIGTVGLKTLDISDIPNAYICFDIPAPSTVRITRMWLE